MKRCKETTTYGSSDEQNIFWLYKERFVGFLSIVSDQLASGRREGLREGLQEGKREGLQEGLREGKREGKREHAVEMARKMLADKLPIEKIAEYSGLSLEDVHKLEGQ